MTMCEVKKYSTPMPKSSVVGMGIESERPPPELLLPISPSIFVSPASHYRVTGHADLMHFE